MVGSGGAVSASEPASKSAARTAVKAFRAKIEVAVDRVEAIRADREMARSVSHQAQVQEALTRTELTLALSEALIGRAEARAQQRAEALRRYLAEARPAALRRRRKTTRMLE